MVFQGFPRNGKPKSPRTKTSCCWQINCFSIAGKLPILLTMVHFHVKGQLEQASNQELQEMRLHSAIHG